MFHRGHSEVLIGLNDLKREGNYEYTDGSPFDYIKWAEGDPNMTPGDGDIVRIKAIGNDRFLADGDSRKSYVFICKKIYGGKPEPVMRE